MSITYGLTAEGFVAKPAAVISAEVDAALRKILGDSAGTEPDGTIPLRSVAGQIKALLVDAISAMWELLELVHASFDPDAAVDESLDALAGITGTLRRPARQSTVTAVATGTPGTVLAAGRVATVTTTNARFLSTTAETIAALSAWAATHAYVLGDRATNSSRCYQCTTAGTSAGSGGPTTTAADIIDGTVHWEFLGAGTGAVDVPFASEQHEAVGALAGALATIGTPVGGWSAVINLADAVVGAAEEVDSDLRARRQLELATDRNATADAIRATVLAVNESSTDPLHLPPTSCTVFANDTDGIDVNGLPPHSVEVLVLGGTDQDIADAIWGSVAAGSATFGDQSSVVSDSQGNPQSVRWSRPAEVDVYVAATVYYDAAQWPASGAPALVEQSALSALLTSAAASTIGRDARVLPLAAAIQRGPAQLDSSGAAVVPAGTGSVAAPGILDVDLRIGLSASPSGTSPIVITTRQVAVFDSTRVALVATAETP